MLLKFHLAVVCFTACEITSVIHSELVYEFFLFGFCFECFSLKCIPAVASFAACDITSLIHSVVVMFWIEIWCNVTQPNHANVSYRGGFHGAQTPFCIFTYFEKAYYYRAGSVQSAWVLSSSLKQLSISHCMSINPVYRTNENYFRVNHWCDLTSCEASHKTMIFNSIYLQHYLHS